MAGIFTRNEINRILADENLTPEKRADQIFALHGQAIDDGYVTKGAAAAARQAAVDQALADAPKPPDVKESEEYKALQREFDGYKTRQNARTSDDFKGVKPKFFDSVYDRLDHGDKHKPYADQLTALREQYGEFFEPEQKKDEPPAALKPQFGAPTQGSVPTGEKGASFSDVWNFIPRKKE